MRRVGRLIVGLSVLGLWASTAQATIFYEETFEALATNLELADISPNGVLWDTDQTTSSPTLVHNFVRATLTPPQGSKYIEFHALCSAYDAGGRCTTGGTHDAGAQIFPTSFSFVDGTTYYFGAFFRFDRVANRKIWDETGSPGNSWNKTFEISGTGTRWGMGIGWPQNYTVTANKFTADLWCSSGSFAWCTVDHPVQNQNGYSATTPYLMDYERWYAVVVGVTMSTSGATGRIREWVNGTLIMDRNQQTMDASATFDDHWVHSTIAQASPGYDSPEHYGYTDHLLFTDSLTTVTNAGLMSDPTAGGGGGGATRIGVAEVVLAILSGWSLLHGAHAGAMTLWRYASTMPSPKAWYWGTRYKWAVKRWQKAAPLMLPAPLETIELQRKDGVYARRDV